MDDRDVFPAEITEFDERAMLTVDNTGDCHTPGDKALGRESPDAFFELFFPFFIVRRGGKFERFTDYSFVREDTDECLCAADVDADIHKSFPPLMLTLVYRSSRVCRKCRFCCTPECLFTYRGKTDILGSNLFEGLCSA
jgi:hypothetical protein